MDIPVLLPWQGWSAIPVRGVTPYRYVPERAATPYRQIPVRLYAPHGADVKEYFTAPMSQAGGFSGFGGVQTGGGFCDKFLDETDAGKAPCPGGYVFSRKEGDANVCCWPVEGNIFATGITPKKCDVPIFQRYEDGKCKPDWLKIGIAVGALFFATTILK